MNEYPAGYRPNKFQRLDINPETIPVVAVESRETTAKAVAEQLTELTREFGVEALKAMLAKMQTALDDGRGLKAGELVEVIENKPGRSEFQEKTLEIFETLGYVEILTDGTLVVDDQKLFADFSLSKLRDVAGDQFEKFTDYRTSRLGFLANAFAGKKVVLQHEFERNPQTESKPMFYLPENREAALDLETIRTAQFHFGLWEVPMGTQGADQQAVELPQPASLSEQGFFETSLAAVLYHPSYGNGARNGQGKLLVQVNGEKVPVTQRWLAEQGFKFSVDGTPMAVRDNARDVIKKHAPHVTEKGLLLPEDFAREQSRNRARETVRISSNGVVSIEGVKHYLGRAYAGRSIRIDEIGDGTAALVELDENGQGTPVGMIEVYQKGDVRLAERKTNSGSFFEAGGKLTQPRSFTEAEFQSPKPGENPDAFFARKQKFDAFKAVLNFDNALKQQASFALFDIDSELQAEIREHGDKISKNEALYLTFAQTFGKDGLEIVAATIDSSALSEQILNTSLNLPQAEKLALIPQLHEALIARRLALGELAKRRSAGQVTDLEYRKISFELNRRVTSLLTAAEDSATNHDSLESSTKAEALEKLGRKGSELKLFAQIFKDTFKGSAEVNFEELRGLSLEICKSRDLDDSTKQMMLEIFDQNWGDQDPIAAKVFRATLQEKLTNPDAPTHFYTLKKDERLVAFMRFDQRNDLEPGAYYAGSFNILPDIRGSAVGEAFMLETVQVEANKHPIYAHVVPDAIVGTKYVEEGFVIIGVDEVRVGDVTTQELAIRRDKQKNTNYLASNKNINLEAVKKGIPGLRLQQFNYRQEKGAFLDAIRSASKNGEVATRYWLDKQNPNIRYLVFESDVSDEGIDSIRAAA